jgi:glucose-6-phosphate isomerase
VIPLRFEGRKRTRPGRSASKKRELEMTLLRYEPANVFLPDHGLARGDLAEIGDRLAAARRETLDDVELMTAGAPLPAEKDPLDAGFIQLPERALSAYRKDGQSSELGQILAVARRLSDEVDRVVVLGIGGSYMGARAIMECCCHPYHNELGRAARGGAPRMYFEGNNVDNDSLRGLLDILPRTSTGAPDDDWAVVVISKSGGTLETAAAFRLFLGALADTLGEGSPRLAGRIVPITGETGRLRDLSKALACTSVFAIPDGVGGRFSVLTPVGLFPAALLGLDVVRLLEGAAAMNEHFRAAPVEENIVLQFVGVCRLLEERRGATIRVLSTWGKGLEAAGLWYDQLLAESLGKRELGATPLTVVNTRDLHSRGQQHQQGRRDKLITNVVVESPRRDALAIGASRLDQDRLNELAEKTLPDVMRAAIAGTNQAYREDARPTADLILPRLDEHALGQFFQMMMLATVVEGRMMGVNPYGQPGVEGYKKHMNANLRGK